MDAVTLYEQLQAEFEAAQKAVEKMGERVAASRRLQVAAAEAEREYRVEKQKRTLHERSRNKTPVSIIGDVVKGYEDIADLALKRDCAQAECDANKEAIFYEREVLNLAKKRADAIREQIDREYRG